MVMLKSRNVAYLFLGFIMATFLDMPNVLPIAIAAAALAYINYKHEKATDDAVAAVKASAATFDGDDPDGI